MPILQVVLLLDESNTRDGSVESSIMEEQLQFKGDGGGDSSSDEEG